MSSTCVITAERGSEQQASGKGDAKSVIGELAIVPPLLGSSQRLLNKDHHEVYYQVTQLALYHTGTCYALLSLLQVVAGFASAV